MYRTEGLSPVGLKDYSASVSEEIGSVPDCIEYYFHDVPSIVANDRHSQVGRFPALASFDTEAGKTTVFFDEATFAGLEEQYCNEELTPEMLRLLYLEGGIANLALRNLLSGSSSEQIEEVYSLLSSPDSLSRQILGSVEDTDQEFEFSDQDQKALLLALHEGTITADVAAINGVRLNLGVVYLTHGQAGQRIRNAVKSTMHNELTNSLIREDPYREICYELGELGLEATKDLSSPEVVQRLFDNSLSLLEVAGAFPMPDNEVLDIVDRISQP